MNIDETITYKDISYPVFILYFQRFKQWHKISVESLAEAISPDGTFDDTDDEGSTIDQGLYFYIPDNMVALPKRDVMRYLNSQA